MLEVKFIKEYAQAVKENLKKRNTPEKAKLVDDVIKTYELWLAAKQKIDMLRHQRNKASQEINKLQKTGGNITTKVSEIKQIPAKITALETQQKTLQEKVNKLLLEMPNMLHSKVPKGKNEKDNKVLRKWGTPAKPSFPLVNHAELIEKLQLGDFETARKTSGQGFNYLIGEMALLDLALQQYGLDFLLKKGFKPVVPPMLLRYKTLLGVLSGLKDFEDVVYKIEKEDLYLIGTAEHTLAAMLTNKTLSSKELPLKVCAITPCFRKEIGGHTVDMKGLFRMHQFNKVEQVIFCKPEDSFKLLEEMQKITEKFFQSLKIPYQVIEICAGDLGAKFARQYDIEAWFPRQKAYREITSAGNCTDYQARALNIKYLDKNQGKKYVHILNNTMVATSRAMVAILENCQQKDGSVKIPTVLQKYMGGLKKLGKK